MGASGLSRSIRSCLVGSGESLTVERKRSDVAVEAQTLDRNEGYTDAPEG